LPEELEKVFLEELSFYERDKKMRYVTSAERIGRKEGKKEGKKENLLSIINNSKKEGLSPEIIAKITGLDTEIIKKIMENEKVDIPLHLL